MPLSFQRWHRLSSRYVKLFSATVVGFRNDPEDQFQFLSDTAATALQPSTKEDTNCVAVVFHSTVQLEWITVPCQLAFNKTLIVCHHNLNKTYLKQGRNVTVLSRSYDECPSGWTKIGPRCHLAIDIHFQNKIQCSKVVGICEGQLVQFNLSDSPFGDVATPILSQVVGGTTSQTHLWCKWQRKLNTLLGSTANRAINITCGSSKQFDGVSKKHGLSKGNVGDRAFLS